MKELSWLPRRPDLTDDITRLATAGDWALALEIARSQLDFGQLLKVDRRLAKLDRSSGAAQIGLSRLKVAILSSSTVDQLLPGLRVAGLRRLYDVETYLAPFGQYAQDILDPSSGLYAFGPDVVLLALDDTHLFGTRIGDESMAAQAVARLEQLWGELRARCSCQIIQQTVLNTTPPVMGSNEHRLGGSPNALAARFNALLRPAAAKHGVDILALDSRAAIDGIDAWHDPVLWLRAKQAVSPAAADRYGDLAMRIVAAQRGRSAKCLVLDLDNTLWGGVIGDDGLDGITLGAGSSLGEAFVAFQTYAANLAYRGVLLAVCSKNDEANALAPFLEHPEMVLKRSDISCFVANWDDKAGNLRRIAQELNIGIDSLVFADDNPFERNLVRRELPMVMVPELPEDPALYARCLSDAGYFESNFLTNEDLARTQLYQGASELRAALSDTTDLGAYLASLDMTMTCKPFDRIDLKRITQLANKTNQFNLTTRRYTEAEIEQMIGDPATITLQVRLKDKFGDHGIIALIIGRIGEDQEVAIETWLMSCRVLGRGVEQACLGVLADKASISGAGRLIGRYIPTAKNGMVAGLYDRLGFTRIGGDTDGESIWSLDLGAGIASDLHNIEIVGV